MGCLLVLAAVLAPRLAMFFIWLLTNWFGRAYETTLWPVLGFLFAPYTTLAYMVGVLNGGGTISGGWLVLLIVAVLADLGVFGSGSHTARRRSKKA